MSHPYQDCFRQPFAKYLLSTNLVGRLQNGMGPLSIALSTRYEGLPYERVGLLVGVFAVAAAIGGPFLGRAVDKRGQAKVLLASAVGSATGFLLLAVATPSSLSVPLVAVFLAGSLSPPLEPCLRSLWSTILKEQQLVTAAYSLDASLQQIIYVTGPLIVVGIAATTSPTYGLFFVAGVTLIGTFLFVGAKPVRQWRGRPKDSNWAGPLRSSELRTTLTSLGGVGFVLGVFSIATVMYGETNSTSSNTSGVLLGVHAVGALIGGLVYGSRRWPGRSETHLKLLLTGLAACYMPLLTLPSIGPMVILMGIAGLFLSPVLACGFIIIDEVAPEGTKTEAFAWVVTVTLIGNALGSATSGAIQSAGLWVVFSLPLIAGLSALTVSLFIRPENKSAA